MRTSVIVIVMAGGFCIAAAALPWFDREPGDDTLSARPVATASTDRPSRPVSAPAPSVPRQSDIPAAPHRPAIDRDVSDDRLLDVFESLRHAKAGADLLVARRIEQDCFADTRTWSSVGSALAGRTLQHFERTPSSPGTSWDGSLTVVEVRPTRAQVDAARELVRRCEGFAARTTARHREDRQAIEDRLLATNDIVGMAENVATHRAPPTPDRLRTILASRDPVAITLVDDDLAALWQRTSGSSWPTGLFNEPSPAMQLAGCDLGLDCGPAGRTALVGCLDDATLCGDDVAAQVLRRTAPADRPRVDDLRRRIVVAITSGDYAIWGL